MSLAINHNLSAINVVRNLSTAYRAMAGSVSRLSSGLRITSAADDAAGLAIRELMRADIASMNQGIRNINDAISLIQTADGALQVIDEKLVRMKELATQGATGTYNSDQRLIIDSEYQAMASEITRIANATDFNGIYLLNGNLLGRHPQRLDPELHRQAEGPLRHRQRLGRGLLLHQINTSTASALGVGLNAAGATPSPPSSWPSSPWTSSRTPSSPRTRSGPTSAPCKTGWRTPSPTWRSRQRTSRPPNRASPTWTSPRR